MMIRKTTYVFCAIALAMLIFFPFSAQAEKEMGIAAVVNDDAITHADLNERMLLILGSSGLPNNKDFREKIKPQVLEGLLEERLMLQEAARNDIKVTEEEIDAGIAAVAEQNKFTAEQFVEILKRQGIPIKTLREQVKAQSAWRKVIQTVLREQVDVKDSDVDVRQERLKANIGKTEFLVSEIFLPIDRPESEADVRKLANQLAQELSAGKAPFEAVAAQFSKAAGADKGGSLGWVQQGQLPEELDNVVLKMAQDSVSQPIRSPSGLHILKLKNVRTIEERLIPGREALIQQIGLERLDRLQRRVLQDLKSAAYIDLRV